VKEDTSNKSTPALLQTTSPPAFAPGAMSVPSTAAPAGTHGPFSLTAQSKTDSNYVFNLLSSDTNGAHYVVYEDGSIYTGQIHDGKRHGFGFWQMQNGRHDHTRANVSQIYSTARDSRSGVMGAFMKDSMQRVSSQVRDEWCGRRETV